MSISKNTSGANHDDLQQMNRVLVLSLMRKSEITTRADIARLTGLKRATITNIIADFIDCGIVKETGFVDGDKGRRSIGIALNGFDYKVIAIRLARQNFSIGLFDITGEMYSKEKIEINFMDGSAHAMRLIKDRIRHLLDNSSGVLSIGVALPGPYIKSENKIVQISDFPGWEDINVVDELQCAFGIPVYAEHDGNASALAEWWFGNCVRNDETLLNVVAGQGTGAGVIQNGQIFQGGHGFAGELGHTSIAFNGPRCECGNRGCLDLYCSSIILMRNIQEQLENYPESVLNNSKLTLEAVADAVRQGDTLAVMELCKQAKFLSYGIVNAINTYDPNIIVLGDELAMVGGELLLEEIRSGVQSRVLPRIYQNLKIELTSLKDSMLTGAMAVAVDNAFQTLDFMKK